MGLPVLALLLLRAGAAQSDRPRHSRSVPGARGRAVSSAVSAADVTADVIMTAEGTWSDWDRRQSCSPSGGFHQPRNETELIRLVEQAAVNRVQVKLVGSGHSFSPIVLTDANVDAIMR